MSEGKERSSALTDLSDKMLGRAKNEGMDECLRLSAFFSRSIESSLGIFRSTLQCISSQAKTSMMRRHSNLENCEI